MTRFDDFFLVFDFDVVISTHLVHTTVVKTMLKTRRGQLRSLTLDAVCAKSKANDVHAAGNEDTYSLYCVMGISLLLMIL